MTLTLGFSPCPNDTFIFDAMIHGKIDTEDLDFQVRLGDVEELNQMAFDGQLDITKLSYHAYAYLAEQYVLLDAGSALGNNCGPLLIARQAMTEAEITQARVAIPGKYTTANFLLSLAYPDLSDKTPVLFSEIEGAVLRGDYDAGLIIHENRFTYQEKGLVKLIDLGEYWESTTGHPIPLGGIVVNRQLPIAIQHKVNRIMERSVRYAFDHPQDSVSFVKEHAQEMDDTVIRQHINLYVNGFTENLGDKGKAAVQHLFAKAEEKAIIPKFAQTLFIKL